MNFLSKDALTIVILIEISIMAQGILATVDTSFIAWRNEGWWYHSTINDSNNQQHETNQKQKELVGSGRPFVCEVIDAYQMPMDYDLKNVIWSINNINENGDIENVMEEMIDCDSSSSKRVQEETDTQYVQCWRNPNGVGVSGLSFCPSLSFKNLQLKTENKLKFYGCLCWSERAIPSQKYLYKKLVGCHQQQESTSSSELLSIYPLEIKQSTPLCALHCRAGADRVRHILSLEAKRIDNHWFCLHLSLLTSAGTYVKELFISHEQEYSMR